MKVELVLGMAAISLVAVDAAEAKVSTPLTPLGKWAIAYEKTTCVLSRNFGDGPDNSVSYGVRPTTLSESVTIVLSVPAAFAKRVGGSKATRIVLAPSGQSLEIISDTHGTLPTGSRAAMLLIKRSALPMLFEATNVRIEAGNMAVSLAPTDGSRALKALHSCEAQLMTEWGVDPLAIEAATTPAEPVDPGRFLTYEDYPSPALQRRSQGTSMILWKVGADGKASDCRTIESAGDPALDEAACSAILRRAVFKPARNVDRIAIPTWWTRKVTWRLPG